MSKSLTFITSIFYLFNSINGILIPRNVDLTLVSEVDEEASSGGLIGEQNSGSAVAVSIPTSQSSKVTSSYTSSQVSPTGSFYSGATGITYSPYQKDGSCKTELMIQSDMQTIADFSVIRIYDTDCNAIPFILQALIGSQKIMVGIYNIDAIPQSVSIISSAFNGDFSKVYAISVGNELVNSGIKSPNQIQTAVNSAKSQLSAIGYNGPIVSVDTLIAYVNNPSLCQYSDFLAVNSHPYWDGNVEPSSCGTWLGDQISNLQSKCGTDKPILITETGWPTQGQSFGNCVPSQQNQINCVSSITQSHGSQVILFTTFNDYWKQPGPYGVEQYWGLFGSPSS
ncbi:LAMI_0B03356g1_1 [Lachancea mirantina]|uniref:LAMI_0B03356g1_1 n=1 Tax=Lachancea mirantina TaxID=1230905 RepID=A0A1G4IUP5_9SACH|nr:LAMI_0B03356g1_1 [Lachancea mirantina]